MSEVTNSDLMSVLLDIKGQTGEMKAHIATTAEALQRHIDDDKVLGTAIQTLQLGAARQRGFLTALTSVGSVLGAGVGYLVERVMFGNH